MSYTKAQIAQFLKTGEENSPKWSGIQVMRNDDGHVTVADKVHIEKSGVGIFLAKDGKIIVPQEDIGDLLTNLYSNPTLGLKSRRKFWLLIKSRFIGISSKDVDSFIDNLETEQIQRQPIRAKVNKPIVSKHPNALWHADLVDLSKYSALNNNVHFLLTIVDSFSKYAWVLPLKNKTDVAVADAFEEIFETQHPKALQTDNGAEFVNRKLDLLTQKYGIHHITSKPYNPRANGAVERFNKTFKHLLAKFMVHFNTKHYLDALPKLVDNYNTTVHDTTGYTPKEVHESGNDEIMDNVHDKIEKRALKWMERTDRLPLETVRVGDYVRLRSDTNKEVRKNRAFRKSYEKQWSDELYKVVDIIYAKLATQPDIYKLMDSNLQLLGEDFYRDMLQKVNMKKLVSRSTERPDFSEGKVFNREKFLKEVRPNMSPKEYQNVEPIPERREPSKRIRRPNSKFVDMPFVSG